MRSDILSVIEVGGKALLSLQRLYAFKTDAAIICKLGL
jgi:hypothetical protein